MKVIIPVAGKGTRMRPFTHSQPKALLPVAGKPVIDHILEKVIPLKPEEIVFVTGHLKDQFEQYIRKQYPKLKCSFAEQKTQLGTADAIWAAKKALNGDVLIIFSDTIFDFPLTAVKNRKDGGVFWAVRVPDPSRFGVLVADKDGYLTSIVEKPKTFITDLVNIGLYYVTDGKLLAKGIQEAYRLAKKNGGEVWLTAAFQYMVEHGAKIKIAPVTGWFDTGTTEQTLQSNRKLLDKYPGAAPKMKGVKIIPPVAIHPSAKLSDCAIGPHVTIAADVTIKGSSITDAIVDEHSTIVDSKLTHSLVGQHVEVREIEGSAVLGDHSQVRKG